MQNYWFENMMSPLQSFACDFHDFHGKRFAQALALQMETPTVFYKNVVFPAQAEYSKFFCRFLAESILELFLNYSL